MNSPVLTPVASSGTGALRRRPTIGQILVESGALDPDALMRAALSRSREEARIGRVLVAGGLVTERQLYAGLAQQFEVDLADLTAPPPDPRLIDRIGAGRCLALGLTPWRRIGAAVVIATSRPERFAEIRPDLETAFGRVLLAVAPETDVQAALLTARRGVLVARAENRVPQGTSCRGFGTGGKALRRTLVAFVLAGAICALWPALALLALSVWAVLTLTASALLKGAALALEFRRAGRATDPPRPAPADPIVARRPTVSVLVPLFRERAIAGRLVRRLSKLTYPRELLDICLVVEAGDSVTRTALADADLPAWMRPVVVPPGSLKTKPRALNFALDFCRGSIVGVYDAEDAPAPDQIQRVVQRFHQRGPEVACLQGVLDFYNARSNWLSRCFAIEYAAWFRVILPGLARLGLVIPLGGTTLFFRREALERLGGWDAHNVTEDAELGLRLARHGYRTELLETVTEEEANCHVWPWVRQRSRWLKGYALTWAVHMRAPGRLWRDLGAWRFLGVQLLYLGTVSQFVLAPLLWSFWLLAFGLPHPVAAFVPVPVTYACVALFLASEVVTIAVGVLAVSGPRHRHLTVWVPTMHLYFPLAALAAYKGLVEIATRPFFWDKTAHGVTAPDDVAAAQDDDSDDESGGGARLATRPPRSVRRRA